MKILIRFLCVGLSLLSCAGAISDSVVSNSYPLSSGPAGNVPTQLPARFEIGLFEDTGSTWMKNSGVPWDIRYRYLTKGWVNNWGYGASDGSFSLQYFLESDAQRQIPAIAYYQMNDEPGGSENAFAAKTGNANTMRSYFSDFKVFMQRAKDFGKPVVILIEPDGVAFLQQQTNGNSSAYAAIAASGLPELASLPNTVAGWSLAFLQIRNAVGAQNVVLGLHVSGWATGSDLFYSSPTVDLQPHVDQAYAFLAPLGLAANVTGSTYDILVGDPLDRDADYYKTVRGEDRWWDPSDTAAINSKSFNRYAEWLRLWNVKSAKRWMLWQIPIGNSNHLNTCNSGAPREGYKDNRTEYFFGSTGSIHRNKFVANGVLGLLFGAGEGCQSSYTNDLDATGQPYLKTNAGSFLQSGGLGIPPNGGGSGAPADGGTFGYDFETGTEGWTSPGTIVGALTPTNVRSFSGSHSLEVTLSGMAGTQIIGVPTPATAPGQTVPFHLWIPSGSSISSLQVFVQESAMTQWHWDGNWRSIASLSLDAWNTISVTLPANASAAQQLGVSITTSGNWSGKIWIDAVGISGTGVPPPPPPPAPDAGTPPPTDAGVPLPPPPPPTLGCLHVMPLGDSITLGVNGGYRNGVYTQLQADACGVDMVGSQYDPYTHIIDKDHEGHPGYTIGDIANNVDGWLASAQPDYVLLMIGTNDVAWWSAMTGAQIAVQHAKLVDRILADRPNAWVVVASIPPLASNIIAPNNVDRAQLGRDLNAAILTNVNARIAAGKKVRFADVYSVLSVSDLYDGVHPTEAAHAKVANVFYQALRPIVSCSTPIAVCGP